MGDKRPADSAYIWLMRCCNRPIVLCIIALTFFQVRGVSQDAVTDSLLSIATGDHSIQAATAYKELAKRTAPTDLTAHLHYTRLGLDLARALDDQLLEGNLYMNRGVALDIHGKFEQAISNYDSAHAIFSQLDEAAAWLASNHINYGAAYYYADMKNLALEHFLSAYTLSEKAPDAINEGILSNNIANIYQELEKYDDAIHYYEQSVAIKESIQDTTGFLTSLTNLGKLYGTQGNTIKAMGALRRAETAFLEQGRLTDAAYTHMYMALTQLKAGDVSKARSHISSLMQDNLDADPSSRQIEANVIAGEVFLASNEVLNAKHCFEKAQNIMESTGLRFDQNRILDNLSKAYAKLDRTDQAYETLRKGYNSHLEKTRQDRLGLEQEMQVRFRTLEKERENIALQKENLAKDLNLARSRRNLIWALALILLISTIAVQIFINRQKIKKLNIQLRRQQGVIEKSLAEKEILLKEIHHRVKNNLQVVSSLLGLQSRKISDPAAMDALREGRTRVHSMSLIHQDLYKKDNPTGIEITNYFNKLVESLFLTYNLSPEKIKLTAEIEPLILDVDTVIPLGLILNELITNALKYAFPHGEGDIHVKIGESSQGLILSVKDNGIGMHNPHEVKVGDSFGFDLIHAFVEKLDGELDIIIDHGTEVRLLLKLYRKAA